LLQDVPGAPPWPELRDEYLHWKAEHANFGKPLDVMFQEQNAHVHAQYEAVVAKAEQSKSAPPTFESAPP